jgi:effector-binding domain-containing protein
MKILKYLLYILLALVAIGIILGLFGPKSYKVERSVVAAGTPEVVWRHLNSTRKINEWSPFLKMDTTTVIEYTGKDGEVGSGSKWTSKKMGKGEQTITSLEPMKSTKVHLKFYMPWGASEADSYMNLEPDPNGTKVTWGITGNNNFMGKIMGSLMSMEKGIGPHFETGLADLQKLVAAEPKPAPKMNYQVNTGKYPGGKYLGVRATLPMKDISSFYQKNIPLLMAEVKKAKVEMAGVPSGIYYTWDEEKMETNMAAAVGIKTDLKSPPGMMQVITVPPGKALTIDYTGGYAKMGDAHMAMDAYIKSNKLESMAPVIEEYYSGPGTEPDSNKWVTKIIYLVK